jgi:CYTH domain-containing protein
MPQIEIERKFLLKSLPNKTPDEIIEIGQYYWKNKSNIWERARTYHSNINGDSYIHTIKKSVSKGVNLEDEKSLTKHEFESFVNRCFEDVENSKYITKERLIYKDGPLKWEVDVFENGYKLIIAEIEIPKKTYKITIPDFMSEVILMEVTNLKQFSNRSLSININELKQNNNAEFRV